MTIFLPLFEVSSYVGVSLNRPHEPLPPEAGPVVKWTFCKGALIERYRVRRKKLGLNSEGLVKSLYGSSYCNFLLACLHGSCRMACQHGELAQQLLTKPRERPNHWRNLYVSVSSVQLCSHEGGILPDDGQREVRVRGRQRVEALRVAERVVLQRVQPGRVLTPVPGELQAVVQ